MTAPSYEPHRKRLHSVLGKVSRQLMTVEDAHKEISEWEMPEGDHEACFEAVNFTERLSTTAP